MKRVLVISMVIVLALGGLGIMTAGASEIAPGHSARQQDEGRAWLGVGITDSPNGVTITSVEPGSPADEAQLFIGDILTAIDGTPVESAEDVVDRVGAHAPGDAITLTVERRGTERDIEVTLGTWPEEGIVVEPAVPDTTRPRLQGRLDLLGLQASITDEGLRIDSIDSDSPLAETDLQAGDVITAINGQPVLDAVRPGVLLDLFRDDPLVFTVLRDGEAIEVFIDANLLAALPDWEDMMPDWEGMMPDWGEMMPDWDQMPGYGPMMGMGNMLLSLLGVDLSLTGEGLSVGAVEDGSLAAEAGLQEGDLITAINGVELADLDMWEMMQALGESEGQVTLTVIRDGEELSLDVTLGPRGGTPYGFGNMPGWSGRGWRFREMMPHGGMFGGRYGGQNIPGMRFRMGPHMGDFDFEEFFENFPFDELPFHWGWGDTAPEADTQAAPDGSSA